MKTQTTFQRTLAFIVIGIGLIVILEVAGLGVQADAGDVVAEGVLELAAGADAAVDVAVALLEGGEAQVAATVEGDGLAQGASDGLCVHGGSQALIRCWSIFRCSWTMP